MGPVVRAHLARFALLLGAVIVINFLLPRLLPGSPLAGTAGESTAAFLPEGAQAILREQYGLGRPLRAQFVAYLGGLARGDLGRSLTTHRPVREVIGGRLPWTLFLVGGAVLVSALVGAMLGSAAAFRPRSAGVRIGEGVVIGLGALPEFLVAMGLIVGLGVTFPLFPVGGAAAPFRAVTTLREGVAAGADILWHAALPMATLVAGLAPAFFLLSRNALIPVVGQPYLRTAQGKGLGRRRVLWHAWRNALPPVLTLLGLRLAVALTGAAVVERLFAYPGVGLLLFEAVARRDYPLLQGIFLAASLAILVVTLALDLAAAALDPRRRAA